MSIDRLQTAIAAARDVVRHIDSVVDEREAAKLVDAFAELERISTAGRTFAARLVEKGRLWMQQGYRTPAHWVASHAQTTVAAAVGSLETARRLEELPATSEAFKSGELAQLQAAEIARAATADPTAEKGLLKTATDGSVAGLSEQCRSVIASATRDEDADERLHRSRYLRHWSDPDGAVRLDARLTPDGGARLIATIQARSRALFDQARRSGSHEGRDACAATRWYAWPIRRRPAPARSSTCTSTKPRGTADGLRPGRPVGFLAWDRSLFLRHNVLRPTV